MGETTKLILVGGFLGAGKTTLLAESAKRLTQRGHAVGLITNDQVPNLVDTAILTRSGTTVREVAGSCFCCNFDGFLEAVESLANAGVDSIVAEPVGSCTDLSATIIQPLKAKYPMYSIAPLSVLVDPARVNAVFAEKSSPLHADAAYILHLQLEEAVLNKTDTLSPPAVKKVVAFLEAEFPQSRVVTISARTGDGIDAWLDDTLDNAPSGTTIAAVDYDRYANGEAVLGWLNAVVALRWIGGLQPDWEHFIRDLFGALQEELIQSASEIGHIKMVLETANGRIAANLTALRGAVDLRNEGAVDRLTATLTINARVQISPDGIERSVRGALARAAYARVAPNVASFHCISPGRVPYRRIATIPSSRSDVPERPGLFATTALFR